MQARYIPDNALPIDEPNLGTVYVYPSPTGKFGAIAYLPKAHRQSWHYSFKSDTALDAYIAQWFDGLRAHKQRVEEARKARKAPHIFVVGDIVTNSWGYDQTNVDWYRVTKTSAHFVWLQPISGATESAEGYSSMAALSTPAVDTSSDDPSKWGFVDSERTGALLNKSRQHAASGDRISMRHGSGTKWDGKAKYESWYV